MIEVFFNDTGYYIRGSEIESVQSCSPASCFPLMHHRYGVCCAALAELKKTEEDIIVYADSRIIEELNGVVEPFDEICQRWLTVIHRSLLPGIRSCVIFRKKPTEFVNRKIQAAQGKWLNKTDQKQREQLAVSRERITKMRTNKRVQGFKENWLNGKRQKD